MKEGWTYKKFKEVCTSITDGDWIEKKDQSQSGIRLVQTGNIGIGEFIPKDDSHKYISEETFNRLRCTEIFEGDILISRLPNPLGRSCILPKLDTRCITAVDCSILRIKKDAVLPKFFVYYTQSQGYFSKIDSESSGTTRARITRKKLEETTIPIPPVSKQILIVERLDAAFAHIDELKANAEKQLSEAHALFQNCLTKSMEPKEGWEEKTLGKIVSFFSGYAFESKRYTNNNDDVLLVCGDNIVHCDFRWETIKRWPKEEYEDLKRFSLEKDDIVLAMDRPWVKSGLKIAKISPKELPSLLIQRTACIRTLKDISSDFIYYALQTERYIKHLVSKQTGVGVPHISGKQILSYKISIPSYIEQM